ncbi:MAG: carboxylating nicotinate-nucleotide diphosphorylase [Balneolaceae bacterium]|nr:carboxylating nicotinate-nucleotide diphosphorylase [Balneolaceae bacterium]
MNRISLIQLIDRALEEDLGFGDASSNGVFPPSHRSAVRFTARDAGTAAGIPLIGEVYGRMDKDIRIETAAADGDRLEEGGLIARAEGPTATLLQGERVILNFLQHLCGVATATRRAVDVLDDPSIRVCDTRKTLPGLRMLQKYAVRCGGGFNHRYRLDGGVMIKDNHIAACGSIAEAVRRARGRVGPMTPVEVETESREQVLEAVEAKADIIMFDNRSPEEVRAWIPLVPEHIATEVSGGITPESIGRYRGCGADYISLGCLTHSVKALDIHLNLLDSNT